MPKSKRQSGGNTMLLLKLHPCVVTDKKQKFSSQRKLHTNTPTMQQSRHFTAQMAGKGVTSTAPWARQASAMLLLIQQRPQESDCILTTELPAPGPSVRAKFHQQRSLNHVFKITHLKKVQTPWPGQPLKGWNTLWEHMRHQIQAENGCIMWPSVSRKGSSQ